MQFVRTDDCPGEWEYKDHPDYNKALPVRTRQLLIAFRAGEIDGNEHLLDSRPSHYSLFQDVTPIGFDYFAGHYRGEDYPCLLEYEVGIASDPTVGEEPSKVSVEMDNFKRVIRDGVNALDSGTVVPNSVVSKEQKIVYIVAIACRVFVEFLRIHPYANGNGHIGRFLIFTILGRYGYWPKRWPLNDRPPDPPYSRLIAEYRRGKKTAFENFVLKCILG